MEPIRPVRPEQYQRWVDRITAQDDTSKTMARIPGIFVSQIWWALQAYYGGPFRTLWYLARMEWWLWRSGVWHSFLICICDRAGWTKVYYYPETDAMLDHHERHGRKCSGSPNCENMNCINDSIPAWFRKWTGWDKLH